MRRAYADVAHGQMHYADCGDASAATPIVLLHQTPRSWREYAQVLPLLGAHRRAIAVDTAGFGESDPVPAPGIEAWAEAALQLLDAIAVARAHVVGHHTGGVIAVEMAARAAGRVASLVLSSTPYTSEAFRRARAGRPAIDAVAPSDDGSHLAALWRKRQPFYPRARPDLLQAFVADALKASGDVEGGHRAVASYRMEDRIAALRAPVLLAARERRSVRGAAPGRVAPPPAGRAGRDDRWRRAAARPVPARIRRRRPRLRRRFSRRGRG